MAEHSSSDHQGSRPSHFDVDRVSVITAFAVADRLAAVRFSLMPHFDPSFPRRVMGAFHRNLIHQTAEDRGGTVTTALRDSPSGLNGDLTPSLTVSSTGGRPLNLFFPVEDALEAVTEEARETRLRLSRLGRGEDDTETQEALKGRFERYKRASLILRTFAVPPPLPPEDSREWEEGIEHMAARYHDSKYEALNPENKHQNDEDHALWDWYAMIRLTQGKVFKPPPSSSIIEIPLIDII